MKMNYLLTIIGIFLFAGNQLFAQTAGVPKSEYDALHLFFDNTQSPEWIVSTNWLDTTTCTVDDWYGITVEDGHVTRIELPDNNLLESFGVLQLPELATLNLSGNSMSMMDFSVLENLTKLTQLKIENNNFTFVDIEPIFSMSNFENFSSNFSYSPQKKFSSEENFIVAVGNTIEFGIDGFYISENDELQWYKNGVAINGETSSDFIKTNAKFEDGGTYYLQITNPNVPGLTLQSFDKVVSVPFIGAGVPRSEYDALVSFYNSTNGNNWNYNKNWLDSLNHSVSEWDGVIVADGHVVNIVMDSNNVSGTIPNDIEDLINLNSIFMVNNNLSGSIPSTITNLEKLRIISLDVNNLSGEIPSGITQLENLESIGLGNNNMVGKIPEDIGNLTNLDFLVLSHNNFSGEIPTSIGSLTKLRYLCLNNNEFSGTIPASIGNLTELRYLDLSNNQLIGPVPVELENITKVYLINLENNLIGTINTSGSSVLKNASVENNRQIPDELSSLLLMDTLHMEGNQLQFNDVEAIFSWDNFDDFNEFIYAPQDSIGISKTIEKLEAQSVTLEIDNYFPGPSDTYQWYKNNTLLSGKTSSTLTLTNLKISDSGNYTCKISNPVATALTLNTRKIKLSVTENTGAGVPSSEYDALVQFYNATDGDNWTDNTNWLDTTNHSVADWYGITVENGHVTRIELPNNNLAEAFGTLQLSELTTIDLSGNSMSEMDFTTLENLTKLTQLKIENNNFTFVDIEPIFSMSNFENFLSNFYYWPQKKISSKENFAVETGNTIEFDVEEFLISENDELQWYKNGVAINGVTSPKFRKTNAQFEDGGTYYLKITNPIVPVLTLQSFDKVVSVPFIGAGVPKSEYDALVSFYNSTNGDNWKNNENWLDSLNHSVSEWVGITVSDGHVTRIVLDSNNVNGAIPNNIENLTYLNFIAIVNNNLSGEIPATISNLEKLRIISLDENNLSGEIPSGITQLENLEFIGLGNNKMVGEIPEDIGNLTNLDFLVLSHNNFNGEIPTSIGSLTKLRYLSLNNNVFSGTIPASTGNLTELRLLDLSNNQLIGPVPVELENITKVYRINLDNNLIGTINTSGSSVLKSASVESNRQIPDELSSLLLMDTLHMEGNQLQFNDIEAIFSWDNYDDINEFIYAPQDSIGISKTIEKMETQSVTLNLDNYFPGFSDTYQWYKNGTLLNGKTNATLTLNNLNSSDSGYYLCKISNSVATDLILNSRKIKLNVTNNAGAGVPKADYDALVEIYNTAGGPGWNNNENWLDTVYHSVAEWYGITVENGRVTAFEMPNNNLTKIPGALNNLSKLKIIDLSSGGFTNTIPSLKDLAELDSFSLADNNFIFKYLTPVTEWENYNGFKNKFTYSPQPDIGEAETQNYILKDTITINIKNYDADESDNFEWFKNDLSVQNSSDSTFSKVACFNDNNAEFHCKVSNSKLPNLTLISAKVKTLIDYSSSDSLLLTQLKNEYPELQTLWASDSLINWAGVTFENGKITALDLSDLGLSGAVSDLFLQFDSLVRLDISGNNLTGGFPVSPDNAPIQKSTAQTNLEYLNISDNNFTFVDLEPAAAELNAIDEFIYAPQSGIGLPFDTTIYKYRDVTFEIGNYTSALHDEFTWFKNGQEITGGNNATYSVLNAALQDSGYYTCRINNSLFPNLTLFSDTIWLHVLIPVGIGEFGNEDINIYPNPADERVFIETGNQKVDVKLYNPSGVLMLEKKDFVSGWIEIPAVEPGIYFFRIENKNNNVINRKVVIQ